jgi:hypothetical protein
MPRWREYQEEAAAFFRDLGMDAATDEVVDGARGTHHVDVVVRMIQPWGTQLWIVECKLWRRRVNKLHVAALGDIVSDVGADRGLLLSEVGFQSGAIRHARQRNITLTSLDDLRANAEEEITERALSDVRRRMELLMARLSKADTADRAKTPPGEPGDIWVASGEVTRLRGRLAFTEMSLHLAALGEWPVLYGVDLDRNEGLYVDDLDQLARTLPVALDDIESAVEALEEGLRANQSDTG